MTPLTQQLEDKKKGCEIAIWEDGRKKFCGIGHGVNYFICDKCKAEIDILEQAIAEIKKKDEVINFYAETLKETNEKHKVEMQKQRQGILDKVKEGVGLNATILDDRDGSDMYLIREDEFNKILEQLNQPKEKFIIETDVPVKEFEKMYKLGKQLNQPKTEQ